MKLNLNQLNDLSINDKNLNKHLDYIRNAAFNTSNQLENLNNDSFYVIFHDDFYRKNINTRSLFYCFIHFIINSSAFNLCIVLIRIV